PSEIGTAGDRVFVHALPIDAWVPLGGGSDAAAVRMGRPLADGGELLKVVGPRSLRLGLLRHGEVAVAVELSSSVNLGEVALASVVIPALPAHASWVSDHCSSDNAWDSHYRRKDAKAYADVAIGEGYEWGGGCWNDDNKDDTPNAPDSNGEGPDCSGLVFKSW